jgi:leader peptidase (prepilin peptidase) / N-methyltransferase
MMPPSDLLVVLSAPFFGSFLTTLAYRLPQGMPIAIARSACPACGATLGPLSLVPVVSWIVQQGKCRHCRGTINPAYPLVEIAALAVALWAMTIVSGWLLAASCLLGWLLLALALIDARTYLLPDVLTVPLLAGGLVVTVAIDQGQLSTAE